MLLRNFTKLKRTQHEIVLNTVSKSLITIAIDTWAQEMNGGRERTGGPES